MEKIKPKKAIFTLTDSAIRRVKDMMAEHSKFSKGLRISTKTKGCHGMTYKLDLVEVENPLDEVVEAGDVRIFIDAGALMTVIGTEMNYIDEKLQPRFEFRNPNEKGRCGCGMSFHV